jgi:hypothetical protein
MDSDWAPDFVLRYVLNILEEYNCRATLFMTGPFAGTVNEDALELGIHPNFMSGSTHGEGINEILSTLKRDVPAAVGVRTHGLYWFQGLISEFRRHHLSYDSSLFLPLQAVGAPSRYEQLTRYPIWWGDCFHMMEGLPLNRLDIPNWNSPGMKVLNFHPIHVYLNSRTMGGYREVMSNINAYPLAREDELSDCRSLGDGIESLLRRILDSVMASQSETFTLKSLEQTRREHAHECAD